MEAGVIRGNVVSPPVTLGLTEHLGRLATSFAHWTGRALVQEPRDEQDLVAQLFEARFALLSHGTEPDPILNYGNRMALALWETDWERFTHTPSRLTAEPIEREERARALADVARHGYTDAYRGIRISTSGRRFRIEQAVVWAVVDADRRCWGQAAMFERWKYLD